MFPLELVCIKGPLGNIQAQMCEIASRPGYQTSNITIWLLSTNRHSRLASYNTLWKLTVVNPCSHLSISSAIHHGQWKALLNGDSWFETSDSAKAGQQISVLGMCAAPFFSLMVEGVHILSQRYQLIHVHGCSIHKQRNRSSWNIQLISG